MNSITYIILLLIVLVVLGMIAALMMSSQSQKKQRTLSVIRGRAQGTLNNSSGKSEQDKRRAEIARKLKEQSDLEAKPKKKATMSALLEQAGLSITAKQFWLFSFLFAIAVLLVAKMLNMSNFVILMLGITGFFGIPRLFLRRKIKKRQKKFLGEFADALEAMVRLLRAGMPVSEAISMAGKEFTGPVGDEMSMIYEEQKVGVPLPEAALHAAKRMPVTEMQMFATGLSIQAQTGASLSEVLMNLAGVIRSRYRLRRKIQAMSAEAKASAMIIGALPFLVGGGMFLLNPEYIGLMIDTTLGRVLLAGGATWMGMGIMVMKVMINFKI